MGLLRDLLTLFIGNVVGKTGSSTRISPIRSFKVCIHRGGFSNGVSFMGYFEVYSYIIFSFRPMAPLGGLPSPPTCKRL
jgi:hypothetical protein